MNTISLCCHDEILRLRDYDNLIFFENPFEGSRHKPLGYPTLG